MAERFGQHKPDPTIKKEVVRARQGAKDAKRSQGLVVVASMVATLMGWALFSHQATQTAVTANVAEPTAIVASVQQTASVSPTPRVSAAVAQPTATIASVQQTASVSPTPLVSSIQISKTASNTDESEYNDESN